MVRQTSNAYGEPERKKEIYVMRERVIKCVVAVDAAK